MTDLMYEIPSQEDVIKVIITKDAVEGTADPVLIRREKETDKKGEQ